MKQLVFILIFLLLPVVCFSDAGQIGECTTGVASAGGCSSTETRGDTSIEACGETIGANTIRGLYFTYSGSTGSLEGQSTYLYHNNTDTDTARKCIYEDTDSDGVAEDVDTLVVCSGDITSSAVEWASGTYPSGTLTNGHSYFVFIAPSSTAWSAIYKTEGTAGIEPSVAQDFYTSPPANLNPSGFTWNTGSSRVRSEYDNICVP